MDFQVEWFDRLASTNSTMRECLFREGDLPSGLIIAAREQTAGRGRQDRIWRSSANHNLCFSLFVRTDAAVAAVPSLTMAAALAVNDLLRQHSIPSAPKWPNDVMVGPKKICGILSERMEGPGNPRALNGMIVGIGLNVNMSAEEARGIDRPATSILIESGKVVDVNKTLNDLLDPLDYWIGKWKQGGFEALREEWTAKAGPVGKPLSVHDGALRKNGTLAGFGDHGELLLRTDAGLETIWSGEIP